MSIITIGIIVMLTSLASAAEIHVTTQADIVGPDGYCSLREAIQAVNGLTSINECPKGDKNTIIHIPAGYYPLDNVTNNGEFVIRRGMYLKGEGADVTTFDALNNGGIFFIEPIGTRKVIIEGVSLINASFPTALFPLGGNTAITHGSGPLAVRLVACFNNPIGCYVKSNIHFSRHPVYFEDSHIHNNGIGIQSGGHTHLNRTTIEQNSVGLYQALGRIILESSAITNNITPEGDTYDCILFDLERFRELKRPNTLGIGCILTEE
jgi:CSLREA domain-containing protein